MSVDELVLTRKRVHSGEHPFRAGDPFDSLYAFRSGFFKSYAVTKSGRSQVTAFPMAGDLAGMDGIWSGTHVQNLVALETGEVCVVPYAHLQEQIGLFPGLHHQVNRIMSREIVREQDLMTLLGTMDGEAKVAKFLLSLASRFAARGYSSTELNLRMSRAEIGSYLSLSLETVSRIVSKLQRLGLIRTKGREVGIVDLQGLRAIATDKKKRCRRKPGTPVSSLQAARPEPRPATLLRAGCRVDAEPRQSDQPLCNGMCGVLRHPRPRRRALVSVAYDFGLGRSGLARASAAHGRGEQLSGYKE